MRIDSLSDEKLERLWRAIRLDKGGARALSVLKAAGFDLGGIIAGSCWPGPYTWSGLIVSIPFLPNRRARSSRQPKLPSGRPMIRLLRELAQATEDPYSDVWAHDKRKRIVYGKAAIKARQWIEAVEFLERVLSRNWVIIRFNPYKWTIASVRWAVRVHTGEAHDKELIDLIDAAYRVAGKDGFHMELEAFKKIELHDRDTRIAGRRKLLGPGFKF